MHKRKKITDGIFFNEAFAYQIVFLIPISKHRLFISKHLFQLILLYNAHLYAASISFNTKKFVLKNFQAEVDGVEVLIEHALHTQNSSTIVLNNFMGSREYPIIPQSYTYKVLLDKLLKNCQPY